MGKRRGRPRVPPLVVLHTAQPIRWLSPEDRAVVRMWLYMYRNKLKGRKVAERTLVGEIVALLRETKRVWCRLAGPGRGDCLHAVGIPEVLDETTTDEYGIPHGWCEYCWASYRLGQVESYLGIVERWGHRLKFEQLPSKRWRFTSLQEVHVRNWHDAPKDFPNFHAMLEYLLEKEGE